MAEWRPVVGYEDKYEVSDEGRVRNSKTGRVFALNRSTARGGYYVVSLTTPGFQAGRQMKVHRLVAMAFLPNPDALPQVNHIDKNKHNNRLENLEWISNLNNHRHSEEVFWAINNDKRHHKLTVENVCEIKRQLWKAYEEIGKPFDAHPRTIQQIAQGRTRARG